MMNKTFKFIKRKTVMLSIAVTIMGGFASCEEHTDEYDGSLRVGNILLADNSVVSPQGFDSNCDKAVGVIFYTNRDTALVVSTHELGDYAYADSLGTVGSVGNDSRTMCGAENTAALLVSEISTPATRSCGRVSHASDKLGFAIGWRTEGFVCYASCRGTEYGDSRW